MSNLTTIDREKVIAAILSCQRCGCTKCLLVVEECKARNFPVNYWPLVALSEQLAQEIMQSLELCLMHNQKADNLEHQQLSKMEHVGKGVGKGE